MIQPIYNGGNRQVVIRQTETQVGLVWRVSVAGQVVAFAHFLVSAYRAAKLAGATREDLRQARIL